MGTTGGVKPLSNLATKGRKLLQILSARQPAWANALRRGVAAAVEHGPVLRRFADYRTVVDIGANHGQFALVARHHCPNARIESFEPLPGPAERFRKVF